MLIHKNKDNNELKRNPFVGEEYLVFDNGDGPESGGGGDADDQQTADDQEEQLQPTPENPPQVSSPEDIDRWLAPSYANASKHETPLVQSVQEITPGNRNYDPKQKEAIEESWNRMMMEYNGAQTYVEHFTDLRNHVLSPEFDPKDERWRQHGLGKLYRSFEQVEGIKNLKLSAGTKHSLKRKQAQEVDASKGEIARDLADIIVGLEKGKGKILDMVEEQMRRDFSARIKHLDKQWAKNPPPQYSKAEVKAARKELRAAKKKINRTLPTFFESNASHEERIKEYRTIYEDIEKQEAQFGENHSNGHEAENLSMSDLEAQYKTLVQKKKEKIDPIASAYMAKVDARVSELDSLIAEISASNVYKNYEDERGKEVEKLQKLRKKLHDGRDIGAIIGETLSSNETMTTESADGLRRPIVYTFSDGSTFETKKGLKQQLDFLNDPRLPEKEKQQFAVGLRESFGMFERDLEKTLKYFDQDLDVIREKIDTQRNGLNKPVPKGSRYEVKWFSAYDTVRAFEIVKEWSKRRYQRAATQRVGKFGSKLLKPLGSKHNPIIPLRTLPNEFDKEVEKSEQEEVNQYKEIYNNKDMWQVEAVAENTRNQDELKACFYLLSENGRLRWDNDKILKQLMHFQDKVTFSDARTEIEDISGFYEKLKQAVGYIWDFDTFNEWKNKNSSTYDSKKQEYEQNCHEWAESAGTLSVVISGMLKKHKEGGREAKVDPILYEKIIEYAIYYGKMGPEEKLYYLIQGIATGLLAPDRGSVINSAKINDYPSIDWFGSPTARGPKPTLADVQEVAQYDEPGFFDWYHRVAMTCDRVTQRVDKTLTQGNKLDHDDLTAFLAYMSETTTDTMLGKNTDGFRLPLTGVQNGTISMLHYMDNMAENADLMPNTPEAFTRFVGSFARYDAITMNRMYRRQGNDYFRWGLVDYNAKPRYVGFYKEVYGRDQLTAKQNMEKVRGYLSVLDPIFFDKIFNYSKAEMKDSEAQAIAQEAIDRYGTEDVFAGDIPKTVDELYQAASKLTAFVLRQHPEKFQEMRKKIKSEHKGQYSKYRKDRLVPAQERIDDMRKQRRAMQSVTPAFGSQIKEPPPPVTSGRKWTIGGQ